MGSHCVDPFDAMLTRLYIILGLFFSVSHVLTVPLGMSIKLPELLIIILLVYYLMRGKFKLTKDSSWMFFIISIGLVFAPLLSNLLALTIRDQVAAGAKSLGVMTAIGRYSPYFGGWFVWAWQIFCLLIGICLSQTSVKNYNNFIKALVIGLFALNVYALYHAVFVNLGHAPDVPWPGDRRHGYAGHIRTQGFLIEPLNLGHFYIYCLPIFFFSKNIMAGRFSNFVFVRFNFYLSVLVFFLTYSLSAALSLLAGYILCLALIRRLKLKTFLKISVATVVLVGAINLHPRTRAVFIDKLVNSIIEPNSVGMTLLDRVYKNQSGMNIFYDYPLFGAGLNASGLLYNFYAPPRSYTMENDEIPFPLNEYTRVMAETGIVGLICLCLGFFAYIRFILKRHRLLSTPEALCFFGGFLGTLIDFNFTNLLNVYFVWVFLAFSIALLQEREAQNNYETA